jgi:hypothetical protein
MQRALGVEENNDHTLLFSYTGNLDTVLLITYWSM